MIDQKPPNFIAECFFLTLKSLQIGFLVTSDRYKSLLRLIQDREIRKNQLTNSRPYWVGQQITTNENLLRKIEREHISYTSEKVATEWHFRMPDVLERISSFYIMTLKWMILIANPNNTVPLPLECPPAFKVLPEFIVYDISDFFLFLEAYHPEIYRNVNHNCLLTFSTLFIDEDNYVHNPFVRSKLIHVLYFYFLYLFTFTFIFFYFILFYFYFYFYFYISFIFYYIFFLFYIFLILFNFQKN